MPRFRGRGYGMEFWVLLVAALAVADALSLLLRHVPAT
jgi:hypothetical protein